MRKMLQKIQYSRFNKNTFTLGTYGEFNKVIFYLFKMFFHLKFKYYLLLILNNRVSNALPDRSSVELKIFGMQGVPRNLIEERQKTKAKEYWEKIINEKNQKLKKEQKIMEKELKKKNRIQQINNKVTDEQKKDLKKNEEILELPIPMNTISFGLTIKQKPEEKREVEKPTNVFGFE
ncbi:zinc c2h2 type family protein, putative [Ichthyophthirius multifiliis]|uniref:Zinc c2h2 type family protein, putative n=1 Tax=Ichthyophthirius multifiliis TaxID=5932 RepID=G0R4T0_ICHMU|nr:zinc c2h2 type family protein, putative [Ichthyophthirius multifiliis]EGR27518.1 zinc c2h2 type family protein, putative [Ichthyophthirius multifiliis]|eukprot:XP_004024970.1 zinc c2h2 type family protein, putative [Ichthyophthirius multifiliis]